MQCCLARYVHVCQLSDRASGIVALAEVHLQGIACRVVLVQHNITDIVLLVDGDACGDTTSVEVLKQCTGAMGGEECWMAQLAYES